MHSTAAKVIIRLNSEITKAGQTIRSGTGNKAESVGNNSTKFNLSLLRLGILKKDRKSVV